MMRESNDKATTDSLPAKAEEIPTKLFEMLSDIQQDLAELRRRLSGASKEYYTVSEFAEIVGRSSYTVREWVRQGRVTAQRITGTGPKGKLLIPRSEIETIVKYGLGEKVVIAVADADALVQSGRR